MLERSAPHLGDVPRDSVGLHRSAGLARAERHSGRDELQPRGITQSGVVSRSEWAICAGPFECRTLEQRAALTPVATAAPEFARTGSHVLDESREAYTVPKDAALADHPHGVTERALDPTSAELLWKVSGELIRGRIAFACRGLAAR